MKKQNEMTQETKKDSREIAFDELTQAIYQCNASNEEKIIILEALSNYIKEI
jgi:hypothetical protein